MKLQIIISLILLSSHSVGAGICAVSDRTIYVSGHAEKSIVPDTIIWVIRVTTQNANLPKAKAENNQRYQAVLKVASGISSSGEAVEVQPIQIDRQYTRPEHGGMREFSHFSVGRRIKIRQTDLAKFEESLDALINSAEIDVNFYYEVSNEASLRENLRLLALDSAKTKAQSMAQRLDCRLGKVLHISEYPIATNVVRLKAPPPPRVSSVNRTSPEARKILESVYVSFEIK